MKKIYSDRNYFFHTTNIVNASKILNKHTGEFLPTSNKYLNDKLVFFYYGKHLGYLINNSFESMYFPVVLGIKYNDFNEKDIKNIYPFDSGGLISRCKLSLNDISAYNLLNLNYMNRFILDVYGGYSCYLSGYERNNISIKYRELFDIINLALSNANVDERIKNIEVSSNKKISSRNVTLLKVPRLFYDTTRKIDVVQTLLLNDIQYSYESDLIEMNNEYKIDKVIVSRLDSNPHVIYRLKEGTLSKSNAINYLDEDTNFQFEYLVNNIPYLNGFCNLIGTRENSNVWEEICYSKMRGKNFSITISDFEPKEHESSFKEIASKLGVKSSLIKLPKIRLVISKNIEFLSFKFTNDFIIFGDASFVTTAIIAGIGTVRDKANTFNEIIDYLFDESDYNYLKGNKYREEIVDSEDFSKVLTKTHEFYKNCMEVPEHMFDEMAKNSEYLKSKVITKDETYIKEGSLVLFINNKYYKVYISECDRLYSIIQMRGIRIQGYYKNNQEIYDSLNRRLGRVIEFREKM